MARITFFASALMIIAIYPGPPEFWNRVISAPCTRRVTLLPNAEALKLTTWDCPLHKKVKNETRDSAALAGARASPNHRADQPRAMRRRFDMIPPLCVASVQPPIQSMRHHEPRRRPRLPAGQAQKNQTVAIPCRAPPAVLQNPWISIEMLPEGDVWYWRKPVN